MKVVFLDVDGVLNSEQDNLSYYLKTDKHIKYLKEIVDRTDAVIVVTSAWRLAIGLFTRLVRRLNDFDMHVYDKTCYMSGYAVRGKEIERWLSEHSDIESFVILDDEDFDLKMYADNLVKINVEYGLQREHVEKAVEILNA